PKSRPTPSFAVTAPSPLAKHRESLPEPGHGRNCQEFVCVPERLRKWGLQFDGYSDPLAFIEQIVDSRALSYDIDLG
ncbi:hypothetical protein KR054_002226, partial [Drosophila jambulina]